MPPRVAIQPGHQQLLDLLGRGSNPMNQPMATRTLGAGCALEFNEPDSSVTVGWFSGSTGYRVARVRDDDSMIFSSHGLAGRNRMVMFQATRTCLPCEVMSLASYAERNRIVLPERNRHDHYFVIENEEVLARDNVVVRRDGSVSDATAEEVALLAGPPVIQPQPLPRPSARGYNPMFSYARPPIINRGEATMYNVIGNFMTGAGEDRIVPQSTNLENIWRDHWRVEIRVSAADLMHLGITTADAAQVLGLPVRMGFACDFYEYGYECDFRFVDEAHERAICDQIDAFRARNARINRERQTYRARARPLAWGTPDHQPLDPFNDNGDVAPEF